jgi:uncharacterized membrane protein YkoI
MNLKQALKKVEQKKIFKKFIKDSPDYYLAHCFTTFQEGERKHKWELGYYSEKTDKLVVFETEPKIIMRDAEEAFKKEGTIKKLELSKVKISLSKALGICDELLKSKYPNRTITQKIIILQHLDQQLYNITLVTVSFDILNIRIDAATGEVISDNIQNIISLGRRDVPAA